MADVLAFLLTDGVLLVSLFVVITWSVLLLQQLAVGRAITTRLSAHGPLSGTSLAALGGAVTPFCSCSTVPVLSGLLRARVRLSACFTFLIASPVINEGVIILLAGSTNLLSVTAFVFSAAVLSIAAGLMVEKAGLERFLRPLNEECSIEGYVGRDGAPPRLGAAARLAWQGAIHELRQVAPYLGVGLLIGAAIYGFVPTTWLLHWNANVPSVWMIPLAALIALPVYVSPVMLVPIGFALLEKGLGIGVLTAFLVAAAGSSLPELILLRRLFKWPLLLAHVGTVWLAAVLLGYAADWSAHYF